MATSSWACVSDDIDGDGDDDGVAPTRILSEPRVLYNSSIFASRGDLATVGPGGPEQEPIANIQPREWWKYIDASSKLSVTRGRQSRPIAVVSLCSGMGSEALCFEMLGIPYRGV
eukprot:3012237-Pyramimonas_sp.AAC.2